MGYGIWDMGCEKRQKCMIAHPTSHFAHLASLCALRGEKLTADVACCYVCSLGDDL
jgi:hypothetical protein